VLKQASDRKMHTDFLLQVNYWDSFLRNDQPECSAQSTRPRVCRARGVCSPNRPTRTHIAVSSTSRLSPPQRGRQMEKDGDKASASSLLRAPRFGCRGGLHSEGAIADGAGPEAG